MERRPLVIKDGRVSVLPTGDTLPNSGATSYQKYRVPVGDIYTIPEGFSSVITGPFELDGELVLEGRLEVL